MADARRVRPPTPPPPPGGARRKRRGQSLTELAVVMPMLLLILLGTIDLGQMFFGYVEMRNAVREGAAYAARNPADTAGAVKRVKDHADDGINWTVPAPTCSGVCNKIGSTGTMTVTATKTFTPITTAFLQGYFGFAPFTMKATASMRAMT